MFTEGSTIIERYALAKEAGFKAVETGFPFGHTLEQVRQAKENAGIEQVLINLKTGRYLPYLIIGIAWAVSDLEVLIRACFYFLFSTLFINTH